MNLVHAGSSPVPGTVREAFVGLSPFFLVTSFNSLIFW